MVNFWVYIQKLYADPGMGDFVYFRLFSGTLKDRYGILHSRKDSKDESWNNVFLRWEKNRNTLQELKQRTYWRFTMKLKAKL